MMNESAVYAEDKVLTIGGTNSEVPCEEAVMSTGIVCPVERKRSLRARYCYGVIFMLTNLAAWFIRDYGQRFLPHSHYQKACGSGGLACFRTMGVLRVSFGCFIFFSLMLLTTIRTWNLKDVRHSWHSGWWAVKFVLLVVSVASPFLFPPDIIHVYGEVARIGAGIFLVLQLISLLQLLSWWNNYWMPDKEKRTRFSLGIFISAFAYIASAFGAVFLYKIYIPSSSCFLNIFFVTCTFIMLIVMLVVSLISKISRGGLLSTGIMALYVVFLCWSAIRSEPAGDRCSPQKKMYGQHVWITVVSFLLAICAIVVATFSTGIDSKSFQLLGNESQREDDIPYNYAFFHLIFSLGAMYFGMLLVNWDLKHSARMWSIDVGWASTWVKIVNEWIAASIYLWKIISSTLRQPKASDQGAVDQ